MSAPLPLQIVPPGAGGPLTRDQKRFNTLIAQIGQARATLQAWQENQEGYRRSWLEIVVPLQAKVRLALKDWALALDAAAARGKWPRGERQALEEMLVAVAGELLDADEGDAQARALFERHAGMDYEAAQRQSLHELKEMAEASTGLDMGSVDDYASEEDLLRQVREREREQDAARAQRRAEGMAKRRKSAAQLRREEEAQRVTQSLREVFRKLASALHPDREPDEGERARKTALMAQVNDAYAREDLLALLELQLQIEQIDAEHLANVDAARLKHYNKVLAEQLGELRAEVQAAEFEFRMDMDLEFGEPLDPRGLVKVLEGKAARLRASLAQLRQEAKLFDDAGFVKRWVKQQRRYM